MSTPSVGSQSSRILGSVAMARATSTRCWLPPLSVPDRGVRRAGHRELGQPGRNHLLLVGGAKNTAPAHSAETRQRQVVPDRHLADEAEAQPIRRNHADVGAGPVASRRHRGCPGQLMLPPDRSAARSNRR